MLAIRLASRGTGNVGPRLPCARGGPATFDGYRPKGGQTLVGWITVEQAYDHYLARGQGQGQIPIDTAFGLARDRHCPGEGRRSGRFETVAPFDPAAVILAPPVIFAMQPRGSCQ